MRKRSFTRVAIATVAALTLAACGGGSSDDGGDTSTDGGEITSEYGDLKVAVVYIGVPGDAGWTYSHEQGILQLEQELGVEVTRVENVAEGGSAEVFDRLAREGYNLIFGTSFGFMDPMLETAAKYPDVCFQHASGYKTADNMGNYFGAMEEARYLSGMIAGEATESNLIGYVAAFPIPEVVRGLNAFALGAKAVNPDAKVQVSWTSTWFDPAVEKEAAQSLIAAGADVLGMHQDTTATGEAAEEAGAKWVGYHTDTSAEQFPGTWLTAPIWNWGPHYVRVAQEWAAGTCLTEPYYGNMADGMINLGLPGIDVDSDTLSEVDTVAFSIIDGTFAPFTGPISDNTGVEQIPAGSVATLEDLLGQQWLVDNVIGTIG